jgi:hypothetical protein
VVQVCNLNTRGRQRRGTKAGGLQVQGQPGLLARPCLKKQNKTTTTKKPNKQIKKKIELRISLHIKAFCLLQSILIGSLQQGRKRGEFCVYFLPGHAFPPQLANSALAIVGLEQVEGEGHLKDLVYPG